MGWEPILIDDLADDARAAILEIARATGDGAGLKRNVADLALFWAYVSGSIDDACSAARYEQACSELCDALPTIRSLALHGGLSGAAWVLAHISEGDSADGLLAEVDDAVLGALRVEHWEYEYDLMSGLVGYGVYFVERTRRGALAAIQGLRRITDHLFITREETDDGVAWHTAPSLLPMWQLGGAPNGYFNCGLAHGVPGVIGLLGHIAALNFDSRARSLCENAMQWMQAQQLAPGIEGRHAEFRTRHERARKAARTAWCYGDPGVAIAGWGAAVRLGHSVDAWHALAAMSARREPEVCGVNDAGLCHGAAGLAHIYNRCYHASGDVVFRDAARAWFRRALELYRAGRESTPVGLVDGTCGIALALLAAIEPVEPNWDRLLLCDLPVAR